MRLVNGDMNPKCGRPRSGVVALTCGKSQSVFVYEHACEYFFTISDPKACNNTESTTTGAYKALAWGLFGSSQSVVPSTHYDKFGEHLLNKKVKSSDGIFEAIFFDQLIGHDGVSYGKFNGIEPFHRNAIVLSNGDICPETSAQRSGLLIMRCGPKEVLEVREVSKCTVHAIYYDSSADCTELSENVW